jgi:hypothetical protein
MIEDTDPPATARACPEQPQPIAQLRSHDGNTLSNGLLAVDIVVVQPNRLAALNDLESNTAFWLLAW